MKNTYRVETLESIYKAALQLFAKFGYKKATVEDIANELGMTKGNIYFYVKNKKDLYEKSIAYALASWQSSVRNALADEKNSINKLFIMFQKGNQYLNEHADLQTVLINDPDIMALSDEEDRFDNINKKTRSMLKSIIDDGVRSGTFREMDTAHVTSLIYNAYILYVIKAYIKSEGESITQIFEEGINILLHGILKQKTA